MAAVNSTLHTWFHQHAASASGDAAEFPQAAHQCAANLFAKGAVEAVEWRSPDMAIASGLAAGMATARPMKLLRPDYSLLPERASPSFLQPRLG